MKLAEVLKDAIPTGTFWTHSRTIVDGCTPISPGCAHCWLEGMYRRNLPGMKSPGGASVVGPGGKFNGTVIERPDRLEGIVPKSNRRAPRVWTYWSDLFHPGVSREFRLAFFAKVARCRGDFHIIITKRPEVAVEFLGRNGKLFPNVLILVTMEDQERANLRAPHALRLAAMGWKVGVLCEPLLGPVDLMRIPAVGAARHVDTTNGLTGATTSEYSCRAHCSTTTAGLSWIITGGESGHNARPAHPDWFRSIRDQATAAGVPFMFKSWGNWIASEAEDQPVYRGSHRYLGGGCHAYRVGGKASGRILNGRTWDEVPDVNLGGGAP